MTAWGKTVTIEEKLRRAKVAVEAARDEALLAVQFHETWRPTVADTNLDGEFICYSFLSHHPYRVAPRGAAGIDAVMGQGQPHSEVDGNCGVATG